MSLLAFCEWLAATENSTALRESLFMYPLLESSHVLFLMLFVGLTVILDVRLLGIAFTRVPVSEVIDRVLPWVRWGFAIMVFTGVLLFFAIPVRTYQSVWFRAKMIMLVLAAFNIWYFHYRVYTQRRGVGHRCAIAVAGAPGGVGVAAAVERHHHRRPLHCLQLVRLRHPAATGVRQLVRRLRRATGGIGHDAAALLRVV